MKAKLKRGKGFRGVLNYILDEGEGATGEKKPEIIGGNMVAQNAEELSQEFGVARKLREDIEKPVWHCSLSLPPGERLDSEKWDKIATDFMNKMKFSASTPWVAVRHNDTDKDHIHIVASRISLDGELWVGKFDVFKAIDATQELEKKYDLVLTPGLESADAEKKQLTDKEINKAIRTGEEPLRQRLQRILDESIKDSPNVVELAERLEAAGVGVRANLASTGRMNGFSFEIEGIGFKGSSLGKKYAWKGLQNAGVTYEQDRDREGLERFKTPIADRGERKESTKPSVTASNELGESANSSGGGDIGRTNESEQELKKDSSSVQRPNDSATNGSRFDVIGDGVSDDLQIRTEEQRIGKEHRYSSTTGGFVKSGNQGFGDSTKGTTQDDGKINRGSGPKIQSEVGVAKLDSNRDSKRNDSFRWSNVLHKRGTEEGGEVRLSTEKGSGRTDEARLRVTEESRIRAKEIDPTSYLSNCGYSVKGRGSNLSVSLNGDELYRITKKQDGVWIWCDVYGNTGGDNIDLVQDINPGLGYSNAVFELVSPVLGVQNERPKSRPPRKPPTLPVQNEESVKFGRLYLKLTRGISDETIKSAEKTGFVRYADGGVFFVGYGEDGKVQNVTKRSVVSSDPIQKRDLKGSDKSYPPILSGNPETVYVVEGGVDALALHDMVKRRGHIPPTVIVSGGANIRSFLERENVQRLLKNATKIIVTLDREKDEATQARTNAAHQKQFDRIKEINPKANTSFYMPNNKRCKDLAEQNREEKRQGITLSR